MRRRSTGGQQRVRGALLCLFICLTTSSAVFSMLGDPTLVEAVQAADLIVVGTIVSERESVSKELMPGGLFFGEYPTRVGRVQVEEVLKGSLPEGPLEIESAVNPPIIPMYSRKVGDSGVWLLSRRTEPDYYHADFRWQLVSTEHRASVVAALEITSGPIVGGLQLQSRSLNAISSPGDVWLIAAMKNVSSKEIWVPYGPGHFQFAIRRFDGASFLIGAEVARGEFHLIKAGERRLGLGVGTRAFALPRTPFERPGSYKVQLRYSDLGEGILPPNQSLNSEWLDVVIKSESEHSDFRL